MRRALIEVENEVIALQYLSKTIINTVAKFVKTFFFSPITGINGLKRNMAFFALPSYQCCDLAVDNSSVRITRQRSFFPFERAM